MKKLVKEDLNEKFEERRDPVRSMGIGICGEIEKYCEQMIDSCQKVNDEYEEEYGDDMENADIDEIYSYANNNGRMDMCEDILNLIKKYKD